MTVTKTASHHDASDRAAVIETASEIGIEIAIRETVIGTAIVIVAANDARRAIDLGSQFRLAVLFFCMQIILLSRDMKPPPPRVNKYWDVPAKGFEHMSPAEYKLLQQQGQVPRLSVQAAAPIVGPSVTCQSRRLYVGNIPFGVAEVNCFRISS